MKTINSVLKVMSLIATLAVFSGCSKGSFQTELPSSASEEASMMDKMTARRPIKNTTTTTTTTTTTMAPPASDGYVHCAYESQFCSFSGTMMVRYGANGVYAYKNLTDGTSCTNDVFGDPILGVAKTCAIKPTATTTTTTLPQRVESSQGATVPSLAQIVDSGLNVFTLVYTGATDGNQIAKNGVLDTRTRMVTLLLYHNRMLYQQNAEGNFYRLEANDTWSVVADPRVSTTTTTMAPTTTTLPPALPPASTGNASSKMGVNIEGLTDWNRHEMYADIMRQSRSWGSANAPWDEAVARDANGWPTTDAGVVVRVSGPSAEEPNAPYIHVGTYKLSFTGRADVSPTATSAVVQNVVYNSATNTTTADVVVPANCSQIMLSFRNTVGGVRNVSLLRPGYQGTGKIFSDEFIAALAPFGTFRFMDYLYTNGNPTQHWSERPTRASATYATNKGGSWEDIIALANQTGKDVWINIPVSATDDYVYNLAVLFKNNINANSKVYVEYTNETWNWIFPQSGVNMELAQQEAIAGDTSLTDGRYCSRADFDSSVCDKYWAAHKRVAKRIVRISEIFAQVFGAAAINNQIRPILATQFGYRAIGERQLGYIQQYKGAPRNFIYGIAGAPYFNIMANGLHNSSTATVDQIINEYSANISHEFFPSFRLGTPYNGGWWTGATQLALARYYGIRSIAYEGGNDYGQVNTAVAAKVASNFDPRMYTLNKSFYSQWFGCGNDLFVHFNLSGTYGVWGSWGLVNNINNLNTPKYNAVRDLSQTPLSSFTTCQ